MTKHGSGVVKMIHHRRILSTVDLSIFCKIYLIKLRITYFASPSPPQHQNDRAKINSKAKASTRNAKLFQLKLLFLFRPLHSHPKYVPEIYKMFSCFHIW